MAIITFNKLDLGYKDFLSGCPSESILSLKPDANIIDITHNISVFNIPQAVFCFKKMPFLISKSTCLIGINWCLMNAQNTL